MDRDAIPGPGTFCYKEQCSVLLPAGRFKHRMSGSVNLIEPGPALRFPLAVLASLFASLALAQSAQKNEEVFRHRGADRDAKLVERARQEGTVVLYTSLAPTESKPLADAFEK